MKTITATIVIAVLAAVAVGSCGGDKTDIRAANYPESELTISDATTPSEHEGRYCVANPTPELHEKYHCPEKEDR